MVDKMGSDHVTYGMTPPGREMTKATTNTPSVVPTTISQSRLATAGTNTRKPKEVRQLMNTQNYLSFFTSVYSKTCLKWPLEIDKANILMENGSLMQVKSIAECSFNEGQKYCRMLPLEHSAILLTCIKQ